MTTYRTDRVHDGLRTTYSSGHVLKWDRDTKDLTLTKSDVFNESKDLTDINFLEKDYFYMVEAVKMIIDNGELN